MSSNLFARFIERIKRPGFLTLRLILISLTIIIFSTSCFDERSEDLTNGTTEATNTQCLPIEGMPTNDVFDHWQEFKKSRGQEKLAVHWHKSNGTPEAIFGNLTDSLGTACEKSAREFLLANKKLFRFSENLEDLSLFRNFETKIGKHLIFQQKNKNIRSIYGGQVAVHFDREAKIIAINNTYIPNINLASDKPKILKDEALVLVKKILSKVVNLDKIGSQVKINSELVFYYNNETSFLAWYFTISTPNKTFEVFVDAQSLRILVQPRDIKFNYQEKNAQVFKVNPVVATHNPFLTDESEIPPEAYMKVTLVGLDGTGFLEGRYAKSKEPEETETRKRVHQPNNKFFFNRGEDAFTETMVYYYVDYTQEYIQKKLGFGNVNNRKTTYTFNNSSNAFYDPAIKIMSFGTDGIDTAEDAEVIIHEYGHAILNDMLPSFGNYPSNPDNKAMGEGFSDYLAASICAHFSDGYGDECIGEWLSPTCRFVDSSHTYCDRHGSEHQDGEIWSSTFWKIRKILVDSTAPNDEKFIKADQFIIESHFLLSNSADFYQGANAIMTVAKILFPNKTDEIRKILKEKQKLPVTL